MRRVNKKLGALVGVLMSASFLPVLAPVGAVAAPVGQGFNLNASDMRFILKQIKISEEHARTATPSAPCSTLLGTGEFQIPNQGTQGEMLPWGVRTVDGSCNNLIAGQTGFATADKTFPRLVPAQFKAADPVPAAFGPSGTSSYAQKKGSVFDAQPRLASNLIVDQTKANPAAVAAATEPVVAAALPNDSLFIPNVAPDVGLSAPYNSWFTMFGQFFDHGLDLTNKGGSGTVFMPLQADDPLIAGPDHIAGNADDLPASQQFMVLTRSTNAPGPDGVVGDNPATPLPVDESADDIQDATNQTSSFIDQSQTYTSHPSHQVFLRQYANNALGKPVSTGKLITGPGAGMADWAAVKAQAQAMLGIQLIDQDVLSVPLLATDAYGKFIRGANGYAQMVTTGGALVSGDPTADAGRGVLVPANVIKTGHAFLDDIAHHATPGTFDHDGDRSTPKLPQTADTDPGTADDGVAATYDDEMLNAHFIAGDGRVNENIALTAVHNVFHSEHNRLNADLQNVITTEMTAAEQAEWQLGAGVWDGERLFQAARFVTEMEYQHLAFEEFARKVQPQVNLFAGYDTSINPAITAEFAHAVYRFGHSMLTETVARTSPLGVQSDIPLLDAFLNPPAFLAGGQTAEQATGSIVRGMSQQVGNELDEFVTEALRNKLLGLPLDLAALNMARARETGTPSLNATRRQLFAATSSPALAPYANWNDFGLAIKHPKSLINFVAAYGKHSTITGTMANRRTAAGLLVAGDPVNPLTPADSVAFMEGTGAHANVGGVTTTGLDDVDLWVGGLAEKIQPFGGMLGSTFNFVFETQMEKLQDGDRMYYLTRTAGLNMLVQLEGNSFAELIQRNSNMENLPADSFSRPDFKFDLAAQAASGPIVDDPATLDYNEALLLIRMSDNTIRFNGAEHAVFGGTSAGDKVWSSEGDDTLRGNDGNDTLEGGAGNDALIGGLGDDIMTDLFGDDVLKGGDGNDALASGQGFDLNQPGRGNDFVWGGSDPTETFGAPGDDFIFGGDSTDIVFGDDGDDWIEGGAQADLLQGDNGAPFQDDPNAPGHDVIDGDGGADDFDAEGGDDIMVSGPGVERSEGMLGFDWVTHESDPAAANSDFNFTGLLPPAVDTLRDRFDLVEGLSGWDKPDTLRGDSATAATMLGHELNGPGIARVDGLADVVGNALSFTGGNVILGGAGSDIIEGRGGNDVIDGDKYLNVRLSIRDAAAPFAEIGTAEGMADVRARVFAGTIRPGQLRIVREILTAPAAVLPVVYNDTAVFSGNENDYDCFVGAATVATPCGRTSAGAQTRVVHARGTLVDGTDTIRNIEILQFADSAAPAPPVIGAVTRGNASATVNWTPPAGTVSGYEVEVQTVANPGVAVGALRPAAAGATSLVVTGLTNGTAYRFRVRALNGTTLVGPYSALSAAVTPGSVAGAPTNVTATAGNAQATVNWVAPLNNGGYAITSYTIQVVDPVTGVQVGLLRTVANPALRTFTVTGLTNGTSYRFRVRAVNAIGTSAASALSNTVTPSTVVVVGTAPGAPEIRNADSGLAGGAVTATANWRVPAVTGSSPITGYRVTAIRTGFANVVSGVLTPAAGREQTFAMTLPAGNYRFTVVAINAAGPGPASGQSNLVTAQ